MKKLLSWSQVNGELERAVDILNRVLERCPVNEPANPTSERQSRAFILNDVRSAQQYLRAARDDAYVMKEKIQAEMRERGDSPYKREAI